MIDSKLVNNTNYYENEFDDVIVKKLVIDRIKYFSKVLLKYLSMHENVFDDENLALTELKALLENI